MLIYFENKEAIKKMRKLKINVPINNLKGEQLKEPCGKKTCQNCTPPEGQSVKNCSEKGITAGDMFLKILSQSGIIDTKTGKDSHKLAFWVVELGIMIADGDKEIEISDDKFQFLKNLIESNKVKVINPMGEKMEDYFSPYVWGQMLMLFDEEKMVELDKREKVKGNKK